MEAAFAEMPLALFTTLASMGAGGFIAVAVALFTAKPTDEQLAKIDRLTLVPLALVILGFIAAFFHLTNPLHAINIFNGLGSSPLSNEIATGSVFVIVAIVYCILAAMGKLSAGARRGFCAVVAVLAVAFALMMGAAYMMDTIVSWNTPAGPVQMLGFALVGGMAIGALVTSQAGVDATNGSFGTAGMVVSAAGVVLGAGGLAVQAMIVSGMANAIVAGSALVGEATAVIAVAVVALIAACACTVVALRRKNGFGLAALASVLALAGILCARLAFYVMELSVGLAC